jgi:predicted Zn-dependent protease
MSGARRSPLTYLSLGLALLVAADMARRWLAAGGNESAEVMPESLVTAVEGALPGPDTAVLAETRARVRSRIAAEGAGTYLPYMVETTDSLLRRWSDKRAARPLRLAVVRASVDGFREEFAGNATWAVNRWNGVTPLQLVPGADSAGADIVITWVDRLDSNRTGRTDITWDRSGLIHGAVVVLATHTPDGRRLDTRQMSALALHELGHALGLTHSPDPADALFPRTRALELTERDRRTARLLYSLPPGSVR